ncbi:MAG: hypothetical protein CM1200mP22_26220 [Dehalococcoidia bacterium]|nr:MAG: hypothetical protein CM1200mP22_26220 [Dehalococcoidia bacterium]
MATMLDGESYLGRVLIQPLDEAGDVTIYLWPVRCLKSKMGGPTFGVDVKGEEVIRYDPMAPAAIGTEAVMTNWAPAVPTLNFRTMSAISKDKLLGV